jgi:hypothetical protein
MQLPRDRQTKAEKCGGMLSKVSKVHNKAHKAPANDEIRDTQI